MSFRDVVDRSRLSDSAELSVHGHAPPHSGMHACMLWVMACALMQLHAADRAAMETQTALIEHVVARIPQ